MTQTKGRRKLIGIVVALALAAVLIVGLTLAYLTDQRTTLNTLSLGKVQIALYEEAFADQAIAARDLTDGDGPEQDGRGAVTVMDPGTAEEYSIITLDNVMPGQPVNKDPKVDNLSQADVYVRVQLLDADDNVIDLTALPYSRMSITLANGWIVDTTDGYLYYTSPLTPAAAPVPVFQEKYLDGTPYTMMLPANMSNADIDDDEADLFSQLVNFKLVAEAVQAEGFEVNFSDLSAPWVSPVTISMSTATRTTTP